MAYNAKLYFPQLEDDSKCGNCLNRNQCESFITHPERYDWWCGNWRKDPNFQEQLEFNFEEEIESDK